MKQLLILFLLFLYTPILWSNEPTITKGATIKFGGNLPLSEHPYIFEDGNNTFLADADYNLKGNRLFFKLAKLDDKLEILEKITKKYAKYELINALGFRYIKSGNCLNFYYSDRDESSTKIYCDRFKLSDLKARSETKLIADLKCKNDKYDRKLLCTFSPDKKYMLLSHSEDKSHAQLMYDENDKLLYSSKEDLKNANLQVANNGSVIGIMGFAKTEVLFGSLKDNQKDYFELIKIDTKGNVTYQDYRPEINFYVRGRMWTRSTLINIGSNSFTNTSFNSAFSSSFKFVLKDNDMYFISFFSEEYPFRNVISDALFQTKGVYVEKFSIADSIISKGYNTYQFDKIITENILDNMFSADPLTKDERIKEFKSLSKNDCVPTMYIDVVDIDKDDNISIISISNTNTSVNIYDTKSNSDPDIQYNRINYTNLKINKNKGLSNEISTATMLFSANFIYTPCSVLKYNNGNGFFVFNSYNYMPLTPSKSYHYTDKKIKKNIDIKNLLVTSNSGTLYQLKPNNQAVSNTIFKITN